MTGPSPETRRRLKRAVTFAERFPRDLTGPSRTAAAPRTGFWADITGGDGTARYPWTARQSDAEGGLESYAGNASGIAFEVNGIVELPVGTRVWLRFAGINTDGQPVYLFSAAPAPILFPVIAEQVSGSAGDHETACSFRYRVKAFTGRTLAEDCDPTASPHAHTRPALGAMIAGGAGIACWVDDGEDGQELSIRSLNETLDVGACS